MIVSYDFIYKSFPYFNDYYIKAFFKKNFECITSNNNKYIINNINNKIIYGSFIDPFKWYVLSWVDYCKNNKTKIKFAIWLNKLLNYKLNYFKLDCIEYYKLQNHNIGLLTYLFIITYFNCNFNFLKNPSKELFVKSYICDYDFINSLDRSLNLINYYSLEESDFIGLNINDSKYDFNKFYDEKLKKLICEKDSYLFKKFNL